MNQSTVRIGRRWQITIPRSIRRQLQLREGDRIAFVRFGDRFVIQPLGKTLLDLRGSVQVDGPQDIGKLRRRAVAAHAREVDKHGT